MKKKANLLRFFMGFSSVAMFVILLAALMQIQSNIAAQEVEEITAVKSVDNSTPHLTSTTPANLIQPKGATGPEIYIVVLKDAPLASYRGGISGLAATNPAARGEIKLDVDSAASLAYLDYLAQQRATAISLANAAIGRDLAIIFEYKASLNGFAAEMTPEEAAVVAQLPNVFLVERQRYDQLDTDAGPGWIGAEGVWDGSNTGGLPGTQGEGVIVGIIDTGVDPWNPSFAATGDDGYTHTNPLGSGTYLGVCDPTNVGGGGVVAYDPTFECNDKLIGVWGYTTSDPNPRDTDGHGSHTSSTAAGNHVYNAVITTTTAVFTAPHISGVAPHANIIVYDGCGPAGCPTASTQAARDQAILDGVDVINFSIGSTSPTGDPWTNATALSWLAVRDAGIFVADSAGNSGPGSATVGSPPDIPWMTPVGASSHNRTFLNSVVLDDGSGNTLTVNGESMTGPLATPVEVVFAVDYGGTDDDRLCAPGTFAPGTFNGEIVICERGIYGRVAKGQSVLDGGAGGMVLAQPAEFGGGPGSLSPDPHVLPAVHINYYEYQALLDYFTNATGTVMGTIPGSTLDVGDSYADIMASFSSRGPNQSVPDIIVPFVTAPGRGIWAAYHQGEGGDETYTYNVIQGTSMASPHVAGSAALMRALHPDWSVGEIQSALMTTSNINILNDDGVNPATPFDMGAGRVSLGDAGRAGFVLDVTTQEFLDADPSSGGEPRTLNLSSMGDSGCFGTCSWTRTISSTQSYTVTWNAYVEVPAGMSLTVVPDTFDLGPYATQTITVTADVSGLPSEEWAFGRVWFTPDAPHLELTKDDGGVSVSPGGDIAYTLSYTNSGNVDATSVVITETLPADTTFNAGASTAGWTDEGGGVYTFAVGDVASAGADNVIFAVTVDGSVASGTTITNTAQITGEGLSIGAASDTTPVVAPTEFVVYLPVVAKPPSAIASATRTVESAVAIPVDALPDAHLTVGVYPVTCAFPDLITITTDATTGSEEHLICPQTVEITDLTVVQHGLTEGSVYATSLSQDPSNGDPYDNLNDGTVEFITVTVPVDAARLVAEVTDSEATDIDLYVGTGDTPSAATEVCLSVSATFIEYCNLNDPAPGTWWILIQNWAASGAPPDNVTLVHAIVPDADAGDWTVSGPAVVAAGDPLTATIDWNEPGFSFGERWYGDFNLGSNPGAPGNVARVNVDFVVEGVPVIETDATDFTNTQPSGTAVTFNMNITNTGTADLDWSIFEDGSTPPTGFGGWSDNFDSYANGSQMHGQGGWKGWDNSPAAGALVSNAQSHSNPHSVAILGASDLVHEYSGYTSGSWVYTTWQYIPSSFTGESYFILLNTYNDGGPNNWSTQVCFNSGDDLLYDAIGGTCTGTSTLPIVYDQWVEIRVEIDLDADSQTLYYNNQMLFQDTWTGHVSGSGALNIGAVDLFANNASTVYYDDISLAENIPPTCDVTVDIPWASASPDSGTNAPGTSTAVDVTFDATGLSNGDYNGYLCVNSNDPVTPLISIPVSMTVTGGPPIIDVQGTLSGTVPAGGTGSQTLDISNDGVPGAVNLDWSIDEVDGASPYRLPIVQNSAAQGNAQPLELVAVGDYGFAPSPSPATTVVHGLPTQNNPGTTITHSTSQVIVAGSIACHSGGIHADNSYFRAFDLPSFGIAGDFAISSVDFGIQQAAGLGGDQPVTVNLYAAPSGTAFPAAYPGSFTLIGSANVSVTDQSLTVLNVPVAATAPANSLLIFELFTPSGQAEGNSFFIGSNAAGQTAPSYIAAAACGLPNPTDLAIVGPGFPNMHIVMNMTGKEVEAGACDTPADIPWASVNPASGSTAQGATDTVTVNYDATALGAGVYTGTLCINSNDPVTPLVEVPVAITVTPAGGSDISVAKTVGTDPNTCAATNAITVTSGTDVTYCYTVTNTGSITLTRHDLVDDQLGTILNNFSFTLIPGASAFITDTTNITVTTVNTATWTAYNPGPTDTATATDSATVTVSGGGSTVTYCRNAINLSIPDNNPTGVNDSLTVAESGTIQDVDVFVNATHSWDGDLIFRVTSPGATTVTFIDRPGFTGAGAGCQGDHFPNMTLDDDPGGSPGTPVETSCTNTNPGYPSGGSYTPNNPLSGFDGSNLNGTWTINVSDNAGADTGQLVDWCVVIDYGP